MNFTTLKLAVQKRFAEMQEHQLFRVNVDKEQLWSTYLSSFPEGSDPIYRERTEHDCSCCRQFVKNIGDVVAIIDGKMVSIWDVTVKGEPAYQAVVDGMSAFVKAAKIDNVFYHFERTAGTDKNFEQLTSGVKTWDHFFVNIKPQFVKPNSDIPSLLGEHRATHDVFLRSINELSLEAIDTVLDLISQNSLLRGAENKFAVETFRALKFKAADALDFDAFVWEQSLIIPQSVSRIRNTAIGTLLTDLSNNEDLEGSVASFENKVNGSNYKRPTALITPKMIELAKARLIELGLTSALERRYANINDITINNILFADRNAKKVLSGDVFDTLSASVKTKPKNLEKVEEVNIDKFITDILPRATTVEVLMENRHSSNLVSLVAPVDPTSGNMFKWDNKFSWSYNGEVADSDLRKAVQSRGGRVDGVFRFSHSWNHTKRNASLMDLHVFLPANKISTEPMVNDVYGNKERVGWNNRSHAQTGGVQDVDYTAAAPAGYIPVENITFPDLKRMPQGRYVCKIHNWSLREPTQGGFKAEIEFDGQVFEYDYDKPLKNKEWVTVAEVVLKDGQFTIEHHLPVAGSVVKSVWGVSTNTFQKVNVIMLSPNFWDEKAVGNKHFFFMLDGCVNDGTARGFYNEFLKEELNADRKVLEVVGSKTKVEACNDQLSGLGFSSTQRNSIVVRVTGAITRTIKVVF